MGGVSAQSRQYRSLHSGPVSFGCDCIRFIKDHLIDFLCSFVTGAKLRRTARRLLLVAKLYGWLFLAVRSAYSMPFGRPGRFMQAYLSRPIINCLYSFQVQPFLQL